MTGRNDIEDGKVYILGEFDNTVSENVIPKLVDLIEKRKLLKNSKIEVYVNSHGGNVKELYGILTLLEYAKKNGIKIITYNLGYASSCGSLLFVYGDERKMYRYARNNMHLGMCVDTFQTVEQLKRGYNKINEHFKNIINIYAEHTKMKRKDIEKYLQDDKFSLNAEQCLKYGFCDEII